MASMGVAMMGTGEASGPDRAREAAERAIKSPLLEDVDLSGAKGILVNITAGPSLSIGEFHEVGDTVRDFADDDATVVVGTVIDMDLSEELRVTVVATGLGERRSAAGRSAGKEEPAIRVVAGGHSDGVPPDYRDMDRPAVYRRVHAAGGQAQAEAGEPDLDYLDIPAFLRRQAD
jgi:cell division protein FtsZ